jgi:hypothetical protein
VAERCGDFGKEHGTYVDSRSKLTKWRDLGRRHEREGEDTGVIESQVSRRKRSTPGAAATSDLDNCKIASREVVE